MKNKKLLVTFVIYLLLSVIVFAACDSTSGRSDSVGIGTFRNDGQFVLPVRVTKATMSPDSVVFFNSKMSLSDICISINNSDKYKADMVNGRISVRDVSVADERYCIIQPYESKKFNYLVTNMARYLLKNAEDATRSELLVPLHLIDAPLNEYHIYQNTEYAFSSDKAALINFYEHNGYEVDETADGLKITDVTGKFYSSVNGGTVARFDGVAEEFEIIVSETSVSFIV